MQMVELWVNFMTTKMTLESVDNNIEEVVGKVKQLISEIEPEVNVVKA